MTQDETETQMEVDSGKSVEEVLALIEQPMKKGEYWYLVDKKWFEQFKSYLNGEKDPSLSPGAVDNSPLFKNASDKDGVYELKERLQEDLDYIFLPLEAWEVLTSAFGVLNENHAVRRLVIEQGHFSAYCIAEVYPIELKLCLYGSKEEILTKQFSRVTTLHDLEAEMRRLFSVDASRDTQLWASGSILNQHSDSGSASNSAAVGSVSGNASAASGKANDGQSLIDAGLHSSSIVTLELRNGDGTWPSSRPKHGAIATRSSKATPGLCGLMNLGNTCFMNSALQCMSNTIPLTDYFLSDHHLNELNPNNPLGMGGQIARTFADLVKSMWSGAHTCLAPREFKMAVGRFAPQFSGFQQQDCQELMAFLLDGLHEDLNRITEKPYIEVSNEIDKRADEIVAAESWENYRKRNDSIIVDTFHGLLKSTLVCPECALVSVTFDPFCYLSLPLPVKRERAIDATFIPARVLGHANEHQLPKTIKIFRLMIPKVGNISDICIAVAKAVNENKETSGSHRVDPDKLIVADVYNHRFHKLYSNDDNYSPQLDDIVVYETVDERTPIPVYLREAKEEGETTSLFGRPLIINIDEPSYESLYDAISIQLRRYMKLTPDEADSDTDEGVSGLDDQQELFSMYIVNAYGSQEIEKVEKNKPVKLTAKSYLAADFAARVKEKHYDDNELEAATTKIHMSKNSGGGKTAVNLSDCIQQFTTTEKLGAEDPWYCPRCKQHKQATKKFDLWNLPRVLIIHMKRFSYSRFWRDKLDTLVDFPVTGLDMSGHIQGPKTQAPLYDLAAVANHYGGLGGGHYTAYAKNRETQQWHYFDDNNVSVATEDHVISKAAYVLFYLRRD
ncbi:Ubiquitin carboxyl-terminal hydrolase 4 [Halotydeus destructor]|nr:Ubiquitin carboxyl-terminal hydrolase 4 [Halotydeus destructor]